jgi:hypothetical protein
VLLSDASGRKTPSFAEQYNSETSAFTRLRSAGDFLTINFDASQIFLA